MTSESKRDPALGHEEDFQESSEETSVEPETETGDDVVGVPLMEGEERVHEAHPSWWVFLPEMILAGVYIGVIGSLAVWMYTPFINLNIPNEIFVTFHTLYAKLAGIISQLGYNMSPEFGIPWWAWVLAILVAMYPIVKAYMKARFTHYVITTDRVMTIQTFPGKQKDWAEIQNIRSFTSGADFVEQRLGVGSIEFLPANEDPVQFNHIDDYEYWESHVKELRKQQTDLDDDTHPD